MEAHGRIHGLWRVPRVGDDDDRSRAPCAAVGDTAMDQRGREPTVPVFRLDEDVLLWFRSQGKGYQTQINALLRAYVDARRRKR